ncbi:MAG: hypothetical protein A2Y28_03010 [Chlamydiae bacterium GWC2_50_10]|nr:MAG: hypothetical protein A2Z85_02630 [Chlamydiae bacterium GWA2_50_15]OGN54216.1 MAG: hypothetical protein A2Y28_03010 [Chlamydiae bacterium GWC2_50_10]OGN55010.1 MAG: hypothetical protein A2098_00030 [Chlamydiae bacterium GWF2_49_8]OGN58164.1 MAG: hypothetical protein A3D18_05980 [Chlamydiae bacterium RIFCSPHIGHO2_02_FULL_49_29]OGN62411.1 MAG: hypothetical protein A3E26_05160 [Chlamydiae bacterium RIFCSPHIGHO2_12_FULL_49_32]OGN67953.1 MAG: hypothetical protein A3I15_06355 [Chlamydiae bact
MQTNKEKLSYSIGLETGKNLKSQFADMDVKFLIEGFEDGITHASPKLPQDEIRSLLTALHKQVEQQQKEFVTKIAEQQKKQGETFLAENKNKEGVVTLPSGLQYKVLKEGKGPHPKLVDTVLVHYKGEFIDGRVFDSSSERGKPHHFTVNQVIPGWSEALQLMNVEAKWRLFVPSYLAYGERGFQREIPPNTTLIFEMELLAINPQGDSHSTP